MSDNRNLGAILDALQKTHDATVSEKTASAAPSASDADVRRQALESALERLSDVEKTAAAAQQSATPALNPVASLEKTAAELERAEAEAIIKEGHLLGAAVFDSFLARANEFAAASTKVAEAQARVVAPTTAPDPQAVALVKQAAATGASDMDALLRSVKQAAAAPTPEPVAVKQARERHIATRYAQGVNDSLEKIAELCHHSFNNGYASIQALSAQS